jgi:plastocyanin
VRRAAAATALALAPFVMAAASAGSSAQTAQSDYLPVAAGAKIVTVASSGEAQSDLVVMTEALVTKEAGPEPALRAFGETYAFLPSTLVVRAEEATRVTFWNLQEDDVHNFMLVAPGGKVLMEVTLPPLRKSSWVFTFHQAGLMRFYCTVHQPEMSGQILVLPPVSSRGPRGKGASPP